MRHYQKALVLGLASSGEAATRLLLAEGTQVVVMDRGDSAILCRRAAALQALGAEVHLGVTVPPRGNFEIAIVSPGIAASSDTVQSVMARGIPVITELELGWSRCACRVLAISGSNGKSTLVKLCAEALAQAGRSVAIAGNYGPPVSAVVSEHRPCRRRRPLDWLVLEVSSFQLETVQAFRPDVGVLLNVTPNHLDRHGDFQTYRQIKSRLFARMTPADTGVMDRNILPEIRALAGSPNRWITAGVNPTPGVHPTPEFFYQSGAIHNSLGREKVELRGTQFDNEIMGLTAAAAAAALAACGVEGRCRRLGRCLAAAARVFQPLPHRLQNVGAVRGIRFVNDSKATNLAAMMAALTMTRGPVRLIAGGLPKCESYGPARELLAEKVVTVYLIGQAAEAMATAWRGAVPCVMGGTLEQAVAKAWREAKPGDTILLSPACASFDQFRSFEERGECFISAIRALS
ncbi:MAG: UDP-N-acetylmuramoyl-L-alanine--D-glutamate ligase [Verrucomicrobia bacterium]|nr:UDP-N-acetylmuramoyl-L-alanine--D-glutamate ligase [Verrucomicrobiota bacterium]MBU1735233.1 UDP-N-acetylmuramoyl-L-alanine--D-glutamate ligase [Verrucomicrobiota bacterium]MBU1857629.1 UDP-N-acetylmuramoyl-L-alanine--D-glutamate ligase [Verrucomicrobiota bacterium]